MPCSGSATGHTAGWELPPPLYSETDTKTLHTLPPAKMFMYFRMPIFSSLISASEKPALYVLRGYRRILQAFEILIFLRHITRARPGLFSFQFCYDFFHIFPYILLE